MKQRLCAFTLVEILVVLGIITLLAALLFTVFSRVQESGRRTVCLSNEKQIYAAIEFYLADSNGIYPQGNNFYRYQDGGWVDKIAVLATSPAIFNCPSDSKWPMREVMATNGGLSLPSSYIINGRVLTKIGVEPIHQRAFPFRGTISHPATTILLTDGAEQAYGGEAPYVVTYSGESTFDQNLVGNLLDDPVNATKEIGGCGPISRCNNLYAPSARHSGRANVLFFDGHVKSMLNSTWYFPNTPYLDPARGG